MNDVWNTCLLEPNNAYWRCHIWNLYNLYMNRKEFAESDLTDSAFDS